MPKKAAPDWAAIRRRYVETDDRAADIAAEGGISKSDLERTRKREKWIRQKPRAFPARRKTAAILPHGTAPDAPAVADAETPDVAVITVRTGTHAHQPDREPVTPADTDSPSERTSASKSKPKSKLSTTTTAAGRRRLLDRLVAAISLKLEQLERRMAQDLDGAAQGDASATDHERETRAIGALIDNLDKVTEMETAQRRSSTGSKSGTADIAGEADRYRRELAERLAKIVGAADAKP